jgi:hypothetical protein
LQLDDGQYMSDLHAAITANPKLAGVQLANLTEGGAESTDAETNS